jgi:hypothetical protein
VPSLQETESVPQNASDIKAVLTLELMQPFHNKLESEGYVVLPATDCVVNLDHDPDFLLVCKHERSEIAKLEFSLAEAARPPRLKELAHEVWHLERILKKRLAAVHDQRHESCVLQNDLSQSGFRQEYLEAICTQSQEQFFREERTTDIQAAANAEREYGFLLQFIYVRSINFIATLAQKSIRSKELERGIGEVGAYFNLLWNEHRELYQVRRENYTSLFPGESLLVLDSVSPRSSIQ